MEHWKIVFALDYTRKSMSKAQQVEAINRSERRAVLKKVVGVDVAYDCFHRLVGYKLRSTEADLFILPRPVCGECRTEMDCVELFGVTDL